MGAVVGGKRAVASVAPQRLPLADLSRKSVSRDDESVFEGGRVLHTDQPLLVDSLTLSRGTIQAPRTEAGERGLRTGAARNLLGHEVSLATPEWTRPDRLVVARALQSSQALPSPPPHTQPKRQALPRAQHETAQRVELSDVEWALKASELLDQLVGKWMWKSAAGGALIHRFERDREGLLFTESHGWRLCGGQGQAVPRRRSVVCNVDGDVVWEESGLTLDASSVGTRWLLWRDSSGSVFEWERCSTRILQQLESRENSFKSRDQLCTAIVDECLLDLRNRQVGVIDKFVAKIIKRNNDRADLWPCVRQLMVFDSHMTRRQKLLDVARKLRTAEGPLLGTIKTFFQGKGLGFVLADIENSITVRFEASLVPQNERHRLRVGQRVQFTVFSEGQGQPVAERLQLVSSDDSLADAEPWAQELAAQHGVQSHIIRLLAALPDVDRRWILNFDLHKTDQINRVILRRLSVRKEDRARHVEAGPVHIRLRAAHRRDFEEDLWAMWRRGDLSWSGVCGVVDAHGLRGTIEALAASNSAKFRPSNVRPAEA